MSHLTTKAKNVLLAPYAALKSIEIGKSSQTNLSYVFNPKYDTKALSWGSPVNNLIQASGVTFGIPQGAEPNIIVVSNYDNRVFDVTQTEAPSPVTKYFRTYAELFASVPESANQTAKLGAKFSSGTYDFLLVYVGVGATSNIENLPFFSGEYETETEPDRFLYNYIYTQFSQSIDDDYTFLVKIDNGFADLQFLVIPTGQGVAFKTNSSKHHEITYKISDFFPAAMEFNEASNIRLQGLSIKIEEV